MKTGVKLRKIDQLIEKFFYNGLRATNSTPVRVVSSSAVISRYSSSSYHHHQHQYDHEKPSTSSSLAEAMVVIDDASDGEKDEHKEDGKDNNEILEEKDKRINRDKNIMESNKAVNIRKRKADKIDKDDVTLMKDGDKEEEPKPSTSKEVITNLLNFKG
uniref:Uncharacterized protein n=1 Tax=Panagrolaimus sp. PS1159 TaxID=55785 RepID=A0AC35G708_9BILA